MKRRTFLSGVGAVGATALFAPVAWPTLAYASGGSPPDLFADRHLLNGFDLMPVTPSDVPREELDFGQPAGSPRWRLDEWWTRHSIAGTPVRRYHPGSVPGLDFDGLGYESVAKRVVRGNDGQLWLEAKASAEYDHPRRAGEAWPHLLVEQVWDAAGVRLVDLSRLQFGLTLRVDHLVNRMSPEEYDPGLHAAQVSVYFTVQNRNPSSPDYGNLVWFGIPVVDNRYDVPPAYYAEDAGHTGQTNQFIAVLPGSTFWRGSVKDGRWHSTEVDLVPLMHHAFAVAQERGYLPATRVEELRITTCNFGWEMPGAFDAALQFKPLTAVAVMKQSF